MKINFSPANPRSSPLQFDVGDEDDLVQVLITLHPQVHGLWMELQSTHLYRHVISGTLLQGRQFEAYFRMSHNSFEHLHALLGISSLSN